MNNKGAQEEISIKELMRLFLSLWNKIVQLFLKAVLFVMKHAIPLVLLIVIGWGIAYFYKDKNPRYKRTFTISATEYSGAFLTQELNDMNIKFSENSDELKESMSLQDVNLKGIHFSVEPIIDKSGSMDKDEYQYFNYLIENRLIDKKNLEQIVEFSNYSYQVEMIYPRNINGLKVFEATLDYLRNDEYAAQMHEAILNNIEMQLEENNKILLELSKYVSSLSIEGQQAVSDTKTLIVEGARGSDLGSMLYARTEVQKVTNKLIAKKVLLDQNFRVLTQSSATPFYGRGIMSKKTLVYPFLLVVAYLSVIFIIYIIRAALALKKELKREEG